MTMWGTGYLTCKPDHQGFGDTGRLFASPDQLFQPLPVEVDYSYKVLGVDHQGNTSSCLAHTCASAFEVINIMNLRKPVRLSRLHLYDIMRRQVHMEKEDAGGWYEYLFNAVANVGYATEAEVPWNPRTEPDRVFEELPFGAYATAFDRRTLIARRQYFSRKEEIMRFLAAGAVVGIGIGVGRSFSQWHKELGPWGGENDPLAAGHAILVLGYFNNGEYFLALNSWGKDFGDAGYIQLAPSVIYNARSSWVIGRTPF